MKSAGKARSNGLYRHIRTSKEIIRNLLNDFCKRKTPRFQMLYNESAQTNICNIYERRCLSLILYIILHSYTTSLRN